MRRFYPKEFSKLTRFEYAEILKIFLMGRGGEINLPPNGEIKLLTDDVLSELLTGNEEENRKIIQRYEKIMGPVVINFYQEVWSGSRKAFPHGLFEPVTQGRLNARCVTRYLIEERLKIPLKKIPKRVNTDIFRDNKLSSILHFFNASYYLAIDNAYPGMFKPWEFSRRIWHTEEGKILARQAIRWLIEEKLKIPVEEIPRRVSRQLLVDNGLGGMMQSSHFKYNLYQAIDNAYPGRFKIWEFPLLKKWRGRKGLELARQATRWLIKERLKINVDEIPTRISFNAFKENGLGGMLNSCFKNTLYLAINNAYPDRFKTWEFSRSHVPAGYWQGEKGLKHAREATRWLIEEKLKIDTDEIDSKIKREMFYENDLRGMVFKRFKGSYYRAIINAYPGKFRIEGRRLVKVD